MAANGNQIGQEETISGQTLMKRAMIAVANGEAPSLPTTSKLYVAKRGALELVSEETASPSWHQYPAITYVHFGNRVIPISQQAVENGAAAVLAFVLEKNDHALSYLRINLKAKLF